MESSCHLQHQRKTSLRLSIILSFTVSYTIWPAEQYISSSEYAQKRWLYISALKTMFEDERKDMSRECMIMEKNYSAENKCF